MSKVLGAHPRTASHAQGVLVIDEHGDRKWGHKTAHIGKQYLGNLGKVECGVVSVTSLFADETVYYPLHVLPYTPEHHFPAGTADPRFKTKLVLAVDLVDAARTAGVSFRAVVADWFYGEDETLKAALRQRHLGYVLAVKPSHAWWHQAGEIGSLREAAEAARWQDATAPGEWVRIQRHFRDGHTEDWCALEVTAGGYGPTQVQRAVIVTTDPATLPDHTTWYLVTNLPAPGSPRAAEEGALPAADLAEVVRLYGLRNWVEQSYKQTRQALGWSQYQVRTDRAIRQHWQLVCCAFSFCWDYHAQLAEEVTLTAPTDTVAAIDAPLPAPTSEGRENNEHAPREASHSVLAHGTAAGAELVGALDHALALLAGMVSRAPAAGTPASPGLAVPGQRD